MLIVGGQGHRNGKQGKHNWALIEVFQNEEEYSNSLFYSLHIWGLKQVVQQSRELAFTRLR